MLNIKSLFTNGLGTLLNNWREIAAVIAVVWIVHALVTTGEKLGSLTEATANNGKALTELQQQMKDAREVSLQMVAISQQQRDLTQQLGQAYEKDRAANQAATAQRILDIGTGSLRLSIKRPVSVIPSHQPVSHTANP